MSVKAAVVQRKALKAFKKTSLQAKQKAVRVITQYCRRSGRTQTPDVNISCTETLNALIFCCLPSSLTSSSVTKL